MTTAASLENLPPQALLSDREVALLYRIPAGSLRNWRLLGRGPRFLRIGRSCRYRKADIEAFLNAAAAATQNT